MKRSKGIHPILISISHNKRCVISTRSQEMIFPLLLGMKTFTVEFAYDGNKVVADCVKTVTDNEVQYQLTPQNKDLLKKYGETIFRQIEGEFLSGEPIVDLAYFSALKEGLENYLYDKKE